MDGGAARVGRLSSFMPLSSPSRAIKFLYAPVPPPPTVWALKPPSWALHLLGLSLANICICTRSFARMHTYHAGIQGGLLYIKPPMHLWFIGHVCNAFDAGSIHCLGKWERVEPWKSRVFRTPNGTRLSARCRFTGPKKLSISRAQPLPLALVIRRL